MKQRRFRRHFLILSLAAILISGSTISYAQEINENADETLENIQIDNPIDTLNTSTLNLTVKLPPNGRELTLTGLDPQITVEELKVRIQTQTNIDPSMQTLSLPAANTPSPDTDVILESQKKLSEYSLTSGTVLYLTESIVIYHTNDMHGALSSSDTGLGIDKAASLKQSTPGAILADAGDATQGLPLASVSKGKDIISLMNAAGYDVMAAGNHEFDYGQEQLFANAELARFPILSANVLSGNSPILQGHGAGGTNTGCHTIIKRGDVKIGFFGLTTCETATATNPSGLTGITFKEEIETAKKEIDKLETEGADVIVALAHLGEYDTAPVTSKELADAMTGKYKKKLDVIIDGHSHTILRNYISNTGILIQQTGTALTRLGKVTLQVTSDRNTDYAEGTVSPIDDQAAADDKDRADDKALADAVPDPSVTAKITEIQNSQKDLLSKQICKVKNTLWSNHADGYSFSRITETNLGDFITDAYQYAATDFLKNAAGIQDDVRNLPVAAIENGGGLRASIPNGVMTMEHLVTAFPFSNTLMVKIISPNILYKILERSVSFITGQDASSGTLEGTRNPGFLQVGGFSFVFDPNAAAGSKIKRVTLEGQTASLNREDTSPQIALVSNNFIMSGGNYYDELLNDPGKPPLLGEIGGELETIQNYIDHCTNNGSKPLSVRTSADRIRTDGAYKGTTYEAAFQLKGPDGAIESPPSAIWVYADGSDTPSQAEVGSDGIARIALPSGPHGLSILPDQKQIYVNNYTGDGLEGADSRTLPSLLFHETRITTPSEKESLIASERSFYIKGVFDVKPPDGATVSVQLLDSGDMSSPLREIASDAKQNTNLKTAKVTSCNNPQLLPASGMPDLIWDGVTEDSFHNGDIKCWFNDSGFTALIPGGKNNGSYAVDDKMGLKDSSGNAYSPLPDGDLKIRVAVTLPDGTLFSEAFKDIRIGSVPDKMLARFSPDSHFDRVSVFADTNGYRIYKDPFPGYWSMDNGFFCEIAPEWRAADATEYTTGKVHFVIYNVRDTSTTYSVELGLLQRMNAIDDPDRLKCYYYSTGEPEAVGQTASDIIPFENGDKLQFVRAVSGSSNNQEGVYIPDSTEETVCDMNISDGISAGSYSTIALYGITAPIQAAKSDIRLNDDNTYTVTNKIKSIQYHITGDGIDEEYEKEVLLNRLFGGKDNYSELEFKHVFKITRAMAGKTLKITAEGLDVHGRPVDGASEELKVTVPANQNANATDANSRAEKKVPAAARTGDSAPVLPLLMAMILAAGMWKKYESR